MLNIKGNPQRDATPIVAPVKRVSIGAELEELQTRLAYLRRMTEVYPRSEPVDVMTDPHKPA